MAKKVPKMIVQSDNSEASAKVERLIPEQDKVICGTICVCQMVLLFACSAVVYLTVMVYLPTQRAFEAGIEPQQAMCVTSKNVMHKNCNRTTCCEWCLSKGNGPCRALYVNLRRPGNTLNLSECRDFTHTHCSTLDVDKAPVYKCVTKQCFNITGTFNCTQGVCQDITGFFNCRFRAKNRKFNCNAERGRFICMEMNSIVKCKNGNCLYANEPHDCVRQCRKLATERRNVVLLSGDDAYAARCSKAVEMDSMKTVWNDTRGAVMMASCHRIKFNKETRSVLATDCVDGATVAPSVLPSFSNFTHLKNVHRNVAKRERTIGPSETKLTIARDAQLLVNLEGCVNSLRNECYAFLHDFGKTGSDHNAASRFPCFYSKNDTSFALHRFDLSVEYWQCVVAAVVPATLIVLSCLTLCACRITVVVGDDAKMRFRWKVDAETGKLDMRKFKSVKRS